MSLSERLRAELDQEVRASRDLLERLPADRWDWKPHEKSMTLSRLATHVAEIPGWSKSILREDEIDFMSPEMQSWTPREMQSKEEILAELEGAAEVCRGHLSETTDSEYDATWTMKAGGEPLMSEQRYIVFRRQILNHMVHHRGQLGVYLRLLEVPLPMVYGPTADEDGDTGS